MENKIILMVSYSDLDSYVNWHGLETALNGLKDQFNTSAASNLNETVQSYTQTVNIIQYNKKFFFSFYFFTESNTFKNK